MQFSFKVVCAQLTHLIKHNLGVLNGEVRFEVIQGTTNHPTLQIQFANKQEADKFASEIKRLYDIGSQKDINQAKTVQQINGYYCVHFLPTEISSYFRKFPNQAKQLAPQHEADLRALYAHAWKKTEDDAKKLNSSQLLKKVFPEFEQQHQKYGLTVGDCYVQGLVSEGELPELHKKYRFPDEQPIYKALENQTVAVKVINRKEKDLEFFFGQLRPDATAIKPSRYEKLFGKTAVGTIKHKINLADDLAAYQVKHGYDKQGKPKTYQYLPNTQIPGNVRSQDNNLGDHGTKTSATLLPTDTSVMTLFDSSNGNGRPKVIGVLGVTLDHETEFDNEERVSEIHDALLRHNNISGFLVKPSNHQPDAASVNAPAPVIDINVLKTLCKAIVKRFYHQEDKIKNFIENNNIADPKNFDKSLYTTAIEIYKVVKAAHPELPALPQKADPNYLQFYPELYQCIANVLKAIMGKCVSMDRKYIWEDNIGSDQGFWYANAKKEASGSVPIKNVRKNNENAVSVNRRIKHNEFLGRFPRGDVKGLFVLEDNRSERVSILEQMYYIKEDLDIEKDIPVFILAPNESIRGYSHLQRLYDVHAGLSFVNTSIYEMLSHDDHQLVKNIVNTSLKYVWLLQSQKPSEHITHFLKQFSAQLEKINIFVPASLQDLSDPKKLEELFIKNYKSGQSSDLRQICDVRKTIPNSNVSFKKGLFAFIAKEDIQFDNADNNTLIFRYLLMNGHINELIAWITKWNASNTPLAFDAITADEKIDFIKMTRELLAKNRAIPEESQLSILNLIYNELRAPLVIDFCDPALFQQPHLILDCKKNNTLDETTKTLLLLALKVHLKQTSYDQAGLKSLANGIALQLDSIYSNESQAKELLVLKGFMHALIVKAFEAAYVKQKAESIPSKIFLSICVGIQLGYMSAITKNKSEFAKLDHAEKLALICIAIEEGKFSIAEFLLNSLPVDAQPKLSSGTIEADVLDRVLISGKAPTVEKWLIMQGLQPKFALKLAVEKQDVEAIARILNLPTEQVFNIPVEDISAALGHFTQYYPKQSALIALAISYIPISDNYHRQLAVMHLVASSNIENVSLALDILSSPSFKFGEANQISTLDGLLVIRALLEWCQESDVKAQCMLEKLQANPAVWNMLQEALNKEALKQFNHKWLLVTQKLKAKNKNSSDVQESDNKNNLLHWALINEDYSLVKGFADKIFGRDRISIYQKNSKGITPLELAIKMGKFQLAENMIKLSNETHNKEVNIVSHDAKRLIDFHQAPGALHRAYHAADNNNLFRWLYANGAAVDEKDQNGYTILQLIMANANKTFAYIEIILDYIDDRLTDKDKNALLLLLAKYNRFELIEKLLPHIQILEYQVDITGRNALHYLGKGDDASLDKVKRNQLISSLLQKNSHGLADLNIDDQSPLTEALKYDQRDVAQTIYAEMSQHNQLSESDLNQLLSYAMEKNEYLFVQEILKKPFTLTDVNQITLLAQLMRKQNEIKLDAQVFEGLVTKLCEHGALITEDVQTLLANQCPQLIIPLSPYIIKQCDEGSRTHLLLNWVKNKDAIDKSIDLMKVVLACKDFNFDFTTTDKNGNTLLHLLVLRYQETQDANMKKKILEITEYLVKQNPELITIQNKQEVTFFNAVVNGGNLSNFSNILVDAVDATFNAVEAGKWLLSLCKQGKLDLVQSLLTKIKPDVNVKDTLGNTALHYVVQNTNLDLPRRKVIAKQLCEAGADIHVENGARLSPIKIALEDVVRKERYVASNDFVKVLVSHSQYRGSFRKTTNSTRYIKLINQDDSSKCNSLLNEALHEQNHQYAKWLCVNGVSPTKAGKDFVHQRKKISAWTEAFSQDSQPNDAGNKQLLSVQALLQNTPYHKDSKILAQVGHVLAANDNDNANKYRFLNEVVEGTLEAKRALGIRYIYDMLEQQKTVKEVMDFMSAVEQSAFAACLLDRQGFSIFKWSMNGFRWSNDDNTRPLSETGSCIYKIAKVRMISIIAERNDNYGVEEDKVVKFLNTNRTWWKAKETSSLHTFKLFGNADTIEKANRQLAKDQEAAKEWVNAVAPMPMKKR